MRATSIDDYREFIEAYAPERAEAYPRMRDFFAESPAAHQDKIVSYLLNGGKPVILTTATAKDVFTGEDTGIRDYGRSDGSYEWGQCLAYYVDKYNLRLPDDFVLHVLNQ